jgi:hypothetical protein
LNSHSTDDDPYPCATGQIPWYVNGTLAAAEAAKLSAHLEGCARCRREYEAQLRLYEAMQADSTLVFAAEPSFRKLMARIGTQEDAGIIAGAGTVPFASVPKPVPRRTRSATARWLAAAVVVEGLGLAYGAWAWHAHTSTQASAYVTLTSPEASYRDGPRVRIVFRSGLSVRGLGVMLHDAGAHVIDGPTESNVYTLGFTGSDVTSSVLEQRVAALRANADVLFAEPLGVSNDSR